MTERAEFDVVVYGATGYTGRLVAEYLQNTYGNGDDVRWAMAGRNADKLVAVREEMGLPADTPTIVADKDDAGSIASMVGRARCVITTVGPYTLYGTPLAAACAKAGVDYVDLCGEPLWMVETIRDLTPIARDSGARIVHSCGFDSIPFDLGVWFLQQEAAKRFGAPAPRVKGRMRAMSGSFSGGTAASLKATMAAIGRDPSLIGVMKDPFALCAGHTGAAQPDDSKPYEDESLGVWVAPFIMAAINTKNVHRSSMLLGGAYGADFQYDEMVITGPGEQGKATAEFVATAGMGKDAERQPGEGPTKEERENGSYDVLFLGEMPGGEVIKVGVTGDKDPGYGSTSKMLAESALCLVQDGLSTPGGVWTPAAAMGGVLLERLRAEAGLTFEVEG